VAPLVVGHVSRGKILSRTMDWHAPEFLLTLSRTPVVANQPQTRNLMVRIHMSCLP